MTSPQYRTMPGPRRNHGGFTLLELLVALAIFAIIAAAAYSTLSLTADQGQYLSERLRRLSDLETAMDLLQDDLMQSVQREVRDEFGDHEPPLVILGRDGSLLKLTRAGRANPGMQLRRSELGRVQYRLEDGMLIREFWRELDRTQAGRLYSTPILSDVDSIRLRVMDHSGEWQEAWPPGANSHPPRPRGIELEITAAPWGAISRVFPLL